MKIPNKKDLQQTGFDHWSDIDLKKFVSFYKKCTAKPYYFLVIDATLASDNLLERMQRLIKRRLEMKKDNMILTEKQQKFQHYHLEKLINMNILHVKKITILS